MQKKILIVEDSPFQAETLKIVLSEMDCKLFVAGNGKDAMDIITDNIDIIIIDNTLPDINGFDLCRNILKKETGKNKKIILSTSDNINPEDIIAAKRIGAVDYVSKTENYKHLADTVKKIMFNSMH